MKHVFVAIPISEDLPFDFAQSLRQVKEIRWIEPKNLHITLVPPWYAEEAPMAAKLLDEGESIPEIIDKLKTLQGKIQPFEIKFDSVSFGPNPDKPRLIWATGEADPNIYDLRNKIYDVLGQPLEKKPFKPHVTLARFRPEDYKKFPVKELNEKVDWPQQADRFVLMESRLTPMGADYAIIEKIKLSK